MCVCCLLCAREGIERNQKKLHFFTLFYSSKVAPSESVSLSRNRSSKQKLSSSVHSEKLQKYTRRLALTRTRLKNFYILSSEEEEEERERERGTFHSRARSFLSRREVEFPPLNLSCPKNRNVARLPSVSSSKIPLDVHTGDTTTQERIDKYAHI